MIKHYFINKKRMLIILFIIGLNLITLSHYHWQSLYLSLLNTKAYFSEKKNFQWYERFKEFFFSNEQFFDAKKNIYFVLKNIEEAKILVEKNDLLNAEKVLLKALTLTNVKNIQNLINIRLARIQLALNHTEKALVSLMEVEEKTWNMIVENIRGDIFLKKNDIPAARAAYLKGLESDGSENMKTILKIKMNSLSQQEGY
ncbi:YfgM family protein [Arsenophonus symbiont of Ornithomya chloropus]|uniref:YfgM family protein n=1 Tax=Arsenophonus symbiont of Ornithomya chloropus TaxID=634121 RepID=UPI0032B30C9B